MARTTADVPPQVASEFSRASRPSAIADATGSPGYTTTKAMQKGMQSPSQFGLPKSPPKGPGVKLRIHVMPDTDMDEPKLPGGGYKDKDKDKK
jgi:hypothetical protein